MTATQPTKSSISIYAELLENIRQISVVASLTSASASGTRAEVVDDGTVIRVHHDGHTQSMTLPATAAVSAALPVPPKPEAQLRWRIPVSPQASRPSSFSLENQALPWNAVDMQVKSAVRCRKCNHPVVEEGKIDVWKDLPSENWAEMMEFWHCHKPHDHAPTDDDHLTKRGYGASNAISAQPSVGFVDITSFMFAESDCNGLSFSSSSPDNSFDMSRLALDESESSRFLHIYCKSCNTEIGLYNVLASSVSLFKWQILGTTIAPCPAPSSTECLAATLTATISRSGSSKSVILPHTISIEEAADNDQPPFALRLWVLSSHVTFASSLVDGKRTAMKILWQKIDVESGNKLIESMISDVQDISLPLPVIKTAHAALESSNAFLPDKEKSFQEWNVGFLERWDASKSTLSNN